MSLHEEDLQVGTNRRGFSRVVAVGLTVAVAFQVFPVMAQSYDPDDEIPTPTLLEKRLTKMGRGLSNVAFGWTELPLTFHRKLNEGRPLTYLLGVVPILGTVRVGMRMGVGVYEFFTFFTSSQEVNFEAILEPEYLF